MKVKKRALVIVGSAGMLLVLSAIFALTMIYDPDSYSNGFFRIQQLDLEDTTLDMNILEVSSGLSNNYDSVVNSTEKLLSSIHGLQFVGMESPEFREMVKTLSQNYEVKLSLVEKFKSLNSTMTNSLNFLAGNIPSASSSADRLDADKERLFARIQYYLSYPDLQSRDSIETRVSKLRPTLSGDAQTELESFRNHALFLLANADLRRDLLNQIVQIPTHKLARELFSRYATRYEAILRRLTLSRGALFAMGTVLIGLIALILLFQEKTIDRQTRSLRVQNDEIKRSLTDLQDVQSQLLQSSKLSELGEMAGGIAHEINNPVSVILIIADEIRDLVQLPGTQTEVLEGIDKISSTANRIGTIVTGLRTFSRDGTSDKLENYSVGKLLSETLSFCSERFRSHGVELRIGPMPAELQVRVRRISISQVVLNLLNNAFDAVDGTPNAWVKVTAADDGQTVLLRVTDSGEGLTPELSEKIFRPFFTTKEIGKGTGLGLSISKGIVESHDGKLYLDRYSRNTSFVVELPSVSLTTRKAA